MKKIVLLACIAAFFGGCGYSNWNVYGEPNTQSTQTTTTSEPTRPEDSMQDGQTIGGDQNMGTQVEFEQPQDRENMFHINTIVSAWGRPDSIRVGSDDEKHYIWDVCRDGKCCTRDIVTDDEGYIMKSALKEAVAGCI